MKIVELSDRTMKILKTTRWLFSKFFCSWIFEVLERCHNAARRCYMKVCSVNLHTSSKAGNSVNDLFAHLLQSLEYHPFQLQILSVGIVAAKFMLFHDWLKLCVDLSVEIFSITIWKILSARDFFWLLTNFLNPSHFRAEPHVYIYLPNNSVSESPVINWYLRLQLARCAVSLHQRIHLKIQAEKQK